MRKTIEKEETKIVEVKEEKKEFNLQEAFVLWKNKSQKGLSYLKGFTPDKLDLIAYFNTNKKNAKEPDVRIYSVVDKKQDKEVACLWENITEEGKRYLTGSTDEKEKLVGFYGKDNEEARPYIRAYYKEN